MAVQLKDHEQVVVVAPVEPPRRRVRARYIVALFAAILVGVLAGWLAYTVVSLDREATQALEIQRLRAEALVEAYEGAWIAGQPTVDRVAVTGTGPGLTWAADRQAAWASNAVTGTGPGLVTIADLQAGFRLGTTPTGTLGLEHLPGPDGPEVVLIGTP
jgi:hypothetical protein